MGIAIQTLSTATGQNLATMVTTHPCSGDNRYLMVVIAHDAHVVQSVTYNGLLLFPLAAYPPAGGFAGIQVFGLANPPVGIHFLVTNFSQATNANIGAISFTGLDVGGSPVQFAGEYNSSALGINHAPYVPVNSNQYVLDVVTQNLASENFYPSTLAPGGQDFLYSADISPVRVGVGLKDGTLGFIPQLNWNITTANPGVIPWRVIGLSLISADATSVNSTVPVQILPPVMPVAFIPATLACDTVLTVLSPDLIGKGVVQSSRILPLQDLRWEKSRKSTDSSLDLDGDLCPHADTNPMLCIHPNPDTSVPGPTMSVVCVENPVEASQYAKRDRELAYRDLIVAGALTEVSLHASTIWNYAPNRFILPMIPQVDAVLIQARQPLLDTLTDRLTGQSARNQLDPVTGHFLNPPVADCPSTLSLPVFPVASPGSVTYVQNSQVSEVALDTDKNLYARDVLLYEGLARVASIFEAAPLGISPILPLNPTIPITNAWSLAKAVPSQKEASISAPLNTNLFRLPDQNLAGRDNVLASQISHLCESFHNVFQKANRLYFRLNVNTDFCCFCSADWSREPEIYTLLAETEEERVFAAEPLLSNRLRLVYNKEFRTLRWISENLNLVHNPQPEGFQFRGLNACETAEILPVIPKRQDAEFFHQKAGQINLAPLVEDSQWYTETPLDLAVGGLRQKGGVISLPLNGVIDFSLPTILRGGATYRISIQFRPSAIVEIEGIQNQQGISGTTVFAVNARSELVSLGAAVGDVAGNNGTNTAFLASADPTVESNWVELTGLTVKDVEETDTGVTLAVPTTVSWSVPLPDGIYDLNFSYYNLSTVPANFAVKMMWGVFEVFNGILPEGKQLPIPITITVNQTANPTTTLTLEWSGSGVLHIQDLVFTNNMLKQPGRGGRFEYDLQAKLRGSVAALLPPVVLSSLGGFGETFFGEVAGEVPAPAASTVLPVLTELKADAAVEGILERPDTVSFIFTLPLPDARLQSGCDFLGDMVQPTLELYWGNPNSSTLRFENLEVKRVHTQSVTAHAESYQGWKTELVERAFDAVQESYLTLTRGVGSVKVELNSNQVLGDGTGFSEETHLSQLIYLSGTAYLITGVEGSELITISPPYRGVSQENLDYQTVYEVRELNSVPDATTGFLNVGINSFSITGTGTQFTALDAGKTLVILENSYVITKVNSATDIEIAPVYQDSTASGVAYSLFSRVWTRNSTERWNNFLEVQEHRLLLAFRPSRVGDIGQPALVPSGLKFDFGNQALSYLDSRSSIPALQSLQPWMLNLGFYVAKEDFWTNRANGCYPLDVSGNECGSDTCNLACCPFIYVPDLDCQSVYATELVFTLRLTIPQPVPVTVNYLTAEGEKGVAVFPPFVTAVEVKVIHTPGVSSY